MPALLRRRLTWSLTCLLTAVALMVSVVAPSSAFAASITGVKVTSVTHSSFTVTMDSLGTGWHYRLYASTNKTDVYYVNLASAPYKSALSTSPTVSVASLPYTTQTYWYRVQATMGTSHHTGDILAVGLLPSTPTGVTVGGSAHHGTYLTWSTTTSGAVVEQATNSTFTSGVHSYAVRGPANQLTPSGLTSGTRYYLRVRAANGTTLSPWSAAVSTVAASSEQAVRVGTYNVLEDFLDGTTENGSTIAPWSQRRTGVVAGIKSSGATVLGVQEAAGWVGAQCSPKQLGTRQIDDLVTRLGSPWKLASTEVRPCLPGWARTGVYIAYDGSQFSAVSSGGQWNIGTSSYPRWAIYQELQRTSTGARFLFVTPHLLVGDGASNDASRESETAAMTSDAQSFAAAHGNLPIVYAGDFNSHAQHPLDGPAVAMRTAHVADALLSAPTLVNAQYNSANGYEQTPPAAGCSVDHVYAAPGVAILSWELQLHLTGGKFVGVIPSDHNLLVSDVSYPY